MSWHPSPTLETSSGPSLRRPCTSRSVEAVSTCCAKAGSARPALIADAATAPVARRNDRRSRPTRNFWSASLWLSIYVSQFQAKGQSAEPGIQILPNDCLNLPSCVVSVGGERAIGISWNQELEVACLKMLINVLLWRLIPCM